MTATFYPPFAHAASTLGPSLLALAVAVPLALLAACFSARLRRPALALQWLAPVPALGAALLALGGGPFAFEAPGLRLSLSLDQPGSLLLAVAAILWMVVGAATFSGARPWPSQRFGVCWLLTMTGSIGVFIAADLLTFYLVYALVSIPAYGLIVDDDAPATRRAGGVYMAFTILGEAFLLLALVLLAMGEPHGSLLIEEVVAELPTSPWRDGALALIVASFGMKIGLAPLNGWMPLTYSAAPIPAAAVLSGAGVKAGIIGLIRFLPLGFALPDWGEALALLGFFAAFYGVAIGITQHNPKTVLAYSSISQMGVLTAALGMALAGGDASAPGLVAFAAANHVLVKGALFLTIGAFVASEWRGKSWALPLAGALGLSLAGLPFTGGSLAKIALKAPLGYGLAATLSYASAAGTALLMLHFLTRLAKTAPSDETARIPAAIPRFWPVFALGAIFIPWLLYPAVGDLADAFSLAKLWDGLWPVGIGAALALGLARWGEKLPRIPAGDTVVVAEAAFKSSFALAGLFEKVDARLRGFPAGGLSLVTITLMLAALAAKTR
jgi:formate hydrogenlyase subunit 3/multisubunit Na+/H+ antiporter MnhD subunit